MHELCYARAVKANTAPHSSVCVCVVLNSGIVCRSFITSIQPGGCFCKLSAIRWDFITEFFFSYFCSSSACVTCDGVTLPLCTLAFRRLSLASGNMFEKQSRACEVEALQSSFCCQSTFGFSCSLFLRHPWNCFSLSYCSSTENLNHLNDTYGPCLLRNTGRSLSHARLLPEFEGTP